MPAREFQVQLLPAERLPLAADEKTAKRTSANLVRIIEGEVESITPIPLEIHGQRGALTVSGRIIDLPENLKNSRLICFLDQEGRDPQPPIRYEWKEETGDFLIEFQSQEDVAWRLKLAVLFESPE